MGHKQAGKINRIVAGGLALAWLTWALAAVIDLASTGKHWLESGIVGFFAPLMIVTVLVVGILAFTRSLAPRD